MVKRQNPNWLCKLGFHRWRDYGESVVVTWEEPYGKWNGLPPRLPRSYRFRTQSREVFTKRECQRCGVKVKRRLVNNPDGTLSCVGWDPLLEPGYEEVPEPQIEPPTPAIQRISFGVLLKYFLHGILYSVLGFVMFFAWVVILLFLVSVGYILGLLIGLGVFFFLIGGMNAIITFLLWFPVKMSISNIFFHGLALCIALVIVNGIFITIPNLVFPGDPTIVATLILGAFLDGIVGKTIAGIWREEE